MSGIAQTQAPAYLRDARLRAGCVSRSTAVTKVPFSPETIGRHERGEVEVTPTDIVAYANGYGRLDILPRYCSECLVGKIIRPELRDEDIINAVLQVLVRAPKMMPMVTRLGEILEDKKVDATETPDFNMVMDFLFDFGRVSDLIRMRAIEDGLLQFADIKKAAPVAPGDGRQE